VQLALLVVVLFGLAVARYAYGDVSGRWWAPLAALSVVVVWLIAFAYVERASRPCVRLSLLTAVLVIGVAALGYIDKPGARWWVVPVLFAAAALGFAALAYLEIARQRRIPFTDSPRVRWSLGIAAIALAVVGIAFAAQRCPSPPDLVLPGLGGHRVELRTIGNCCLSTWEMLFHIEPTSKTHPMCTWVKPADW
jgi:hypothetical protein